MAPQIQLRSVARASTLTLSILRVLAMAATASLLVVGCGGGSSGHMDTAETLTPPQPAIQNGVFKDTNVRGLAFVSGNQRGITDTRGRYTCETGERLSFSIGRVKLGETACTTLAHPPALVGNGTFHDPAALDMARFLIMLDQDGDPRDGIFISDALRSIADNWVPIDFGAADFEAQLSPIVSDIFTTETRVIAAPPTASEAFAHMEPTLACAYSGAFAGVLIDNGRQAGSVTLTVIREPDTHVVNFELEHYLMPDRAPAIALSTAGEVQLETVTRVYNRATWVESEIRWEYLSADRISGHWKDAFTNQFAGSATDFFLIRLGSDTADYRFVGRFLGEETRGTLELGLTGDRITGSAIAFASERPFGVTGTVRGDQVVLSSDAGTDTASATLLRDSDGSPIGLRGPWPGVPSGSFSANGCRLN